MKSLYGLLFGSTIIFLIVFVILSPLFTIWAWNVLFGNLLTIPYSFETHFAVLVLSSFFGSSKVSSKNDS